MNGFAVEFLINLFNNIMDSKRLYMIKKKYATEKRKKVYESPNRCEQAFYVTNRRGGKQCSSLEDFKKHIESQFEFGKFGWFNFGTEWEIDHIIPLSKGGEHTLSNLQILTKLENRQKYNKLPTKSV